MKTNLFQRLEAHGYEQVVFGHDRVSGLRAIISVHNTTLGPALGGTRFYPYADEDEALQDVLNLSRSMTYKASVAGLDLGGGKAVILGDPNIKKTESLLLAFGRLVEGLGGAYITTEDSGTSPADLTTIHRATKYAVGCSPDKGGWGDPSPYTALGCAEGIKACAEAAWGSTDISGKKVALQGVGHVGYPLAKYLHEMGAKLIVTDTNKESLEKAKEEFNAEVVGVDAIYGVDCDIFAPCAMGGAINAKTIDQLKCKVVAGAANNQLASEDMSLKLMEKGIIYAPDYVINAGGLIHVGSEWLKKDHVFVEKKTKEVFNSVARVLEIAAKENAPTDQVALRIAEERLKQNS